jgi:hypothetical protein
MEEDTEVFDFLAGLVFLHLQAQYIDILLKLFKQPSLQGELLLPKSSLLVSSFANYLRKIQSQSKFYFSSYANYFRKIQYQSKFYFSSYANYFRKIQYQSKFYFSSYANYYSKIT